MKEFIRVKKAFTLIEIVLVVILLSTISFLVLTNFNFNTQEKYKIKLEDIKEFMFKNFEYENELNLTCIEDEALDCYVFIDKNINKNIKIENLFSEIPDVYNYDKELSNFEFMDIRLDNIEFTPFFQLIINGDKKHQNIIVDDLDGKVYLFSSISKKAKVFESTNEVVDRFLDDELKVKDAL